LQYCYDEIYEFKVQLLDDALRCLMYYFRYIVAWRSIPLSVIWLVSFLFVCWHTFMMWAVFPLLVVLSLIVNRDEDRRMTMTRGGKNAPLTDDGYRWTAAWQSTDEMIAFAKRIIEEELRGKVFEAQKLRVFAACSTRNGLPVVLLDELRETLKKADFVSHVDDVGTFSKDDPLLVDGRLRAKFVRSGPGPDQFTVQFEAHGNAKVPQEPLAVKTRRVRSRSISSSSVVSAVTTVNYLLPDKIETLIQKVVVILEAIKVNALPAVSAITDVVTWESGNAVYGLVSGLVLVSALFFFAGYLEVSGHMEESKPAEVIVTVVRSIDNVVMAVMFLIIFLGQSWWVVAISNVLKMLSRLNSPRKAPKIWAFLKEDSKQKLALEAVDRQREQEYGRGMPHLPHMTTTNVKYLASSNQTFQTQLPQLPPPA